MFTSLSKGLILPGSEREPTDLEKEKAMGPEHDAELVELAGLRYWNEHEARVVVEAWRRSGESRAAFSRRYGIHPTRLGRWARQMGDRAEGPVLFHPVHLVQREERGWGGPIEIELGRDCRVRVAGGFETRDLERVLGVLAQGGWC
jgi:hypothetical protein